MICEFDYKEMNYEELASYITLRDGNVSKECIYLFSDIIMSELVSEKYMTHQKDSIIMMFMEVISKTNLLEEEKIELKEDINEVEFENDGNINKYVKKIRR